jgi:outer membrane protein assembly factor BamB
VAAGALALAATLLAACGAAPTPAAAPPRPSTVITPAAPATPLPAGADIDWTTYHHDNARTGAGTVEPPGTLTTAWRAALDGAVFGQPLVVGDTVLAATEKDTVYGLNATTGAVLWSAHVATPQPKSGLQCGDIDPLGITSTMVYDPATGLVFALAESAGGAHTLYGIDVKSGKVAVRAEVEPPAGDRLATQQRSALTLLNGRIYIAYGGLYGDCGNYIGSVVSVTTAGADPLHYQVPTGREGGIWAPGGAVVTNGTLFYAAGNGESTNGGYDGSDSVIALSPALQRTDVFAPSTWPQDNADDLDLGSDSPAVLGSWLLEVGKRGTGYVLSAGHLGGVGGQLKQTNVCRAFGGNTVANGLIIVPCSNGTVAVAIAPDGTPSVAWRSTVPADGSPVAGGGAIWTVDYDNGVLYALSPADGSVRAKLTVGPLPHFASPTVAGSRAYVGTTTGVVAVGGV